VHIVVVLFCRSLSCMMFMCSVCLCCLSGVINNNNNNNNNNNMCSYTKIRQLGNYSRITVLNVQAAVGSAHGV